MNIAALLRIPLLACLCMASACASGRDKVLVTTPDGEQRSVTISREAQAQGAAAADIGALRRQMESTQGQLEEFNERARMLTERMDRMEKAFSEMSRTYRGEVVERAAEQDLKLESLTREMDDLSVETRAFIAVMSRKGGISAREHDRAVAEIRAARETGSAPPAPPAASGGETPPPAAPARELDPTERYQLAYAHYRKGEFEQAYEAFDRYVTDHPDTSLADNAAYWAGESLMSMGRYADAAARFGAMASGYPNSVKAPTALLRAGQALAQGGDAAGARARFGELLERYPTSSEALRAGEERDRLPAGESPPPAADGSPAAP